jgi:hypothetical protein
MAARTSRSIRTFHGEALDPDLALEPGGVVQLDHAGAVAGDVDRAGLAGLGRAGEAEGEVLGERDAGADSAPQETVQRQPLGSPAHVPERDLDGAERTPKRGQVVPGRVGHGRNASPLARVQVERIEPREPLAEGLDQPGGVAVGAFAQPDEPLICLHLDDGLRERRGGAVREPVRRRERQVHRRRADTPDLHQGPPAL